MNTYIKNIIKNCKSSEEIINIAYNLEMMIKAAGEKYINININKDTDDEFIDKCLLAEEFEEKLQSEMLCDCSNDLYL
ncbi:MAG: hypothetical protein RSA91_00920 [Bacilli bacterium]